MDAVEKQLLNDHPEKPSLFGIMGALYAGYHRFIEDRNGTISCIDCGLKIKIVSEEE